VFSFFSHEYGLVSKYQMERDAQHCDGFDGVVHSLGVSVPECAERDVLSAGDRRLSRDVQSRVQTVYAAWVRRC
jgi:hypothetical protein